MSYLRRCRRNPKAAAYLGRLRWLELRRHGVLWMNGGMSANVRNGLRMAKWRHGVPLTPRWSGGLRRGAPEVRRELMKLR